MTPAMLISADAITHNLCSIYAAKILSFIFNWIADYALKEHL